MGNMDCTAINKMPSKHSHPPNPARVAAVKTWGAIRDRASTSEETTSSVINNCTQNLSLAAAAAVPRRDHLARMVRRKRQAQDSKMAATSAKSPGIPNFKMAAVKLSTDVIRAFVDSFDTILVDCDGVLWAGSKLITHSVDTINFLKENGKRVFYVTNNSTKTRSQYLSRLLQIGYNAEEREIATSGFLVASYLKSIDFDKKVYLIGSKGLSEELSNHGINHTPPGPESMETDIKSYISSEFKFEDDIGAVVVGFDEYISYPKILQACNYLSRPDCLFLATNTDETFPMEIPLVVPGTGTMVRAVQTASQRTPEVFGKPFAPMFQAISKRCEIIPERTLMVGDRLNTDINFGKNCNLQTLLVLSGVTTLKKLHEQEELGDEKMVPHYYTDTLGDILQLLKTLD